MTCEECGNSMYETNDGFGYFYRCDECGHEWFWEEHCDTCGDKLESDRCLNCERRSLQVFDN